MKRTTKKHEYEVGTAIVFNGEPTGKEQAKLVAKKLVKRAGERIKTETKLFLFDKFHGTHYRDIYHDIIEDAKRRRFEASIGLQRV